MDAPILHEKGSIYYPFSSNYFDTAQYRGHTVDLCFSWTSTLLRLCQIALSAFD